MTREEAIARLKLDRDLCNFNPMTGEEEPMNEDCRKSAEALDIAIKVLEQEPCEDAISRKSVLDMATIIETDDYSGNEVMEVVDTDDIKALPSVTSAPKKGKWIFRGNYDEVGILYCSNCKHEIDVSEGYFKWCPNCGAKMDEDERKLKYADQDTLKYADQDTMMPAT